ncbi:MAG: hypothetical protein QOG83_1676 [Alphaproteobacteria bacterium]|nr:hypothetical protein [Alphaproteobacteria bacterium]
MPTPEEYRRYAGMCDKLASDSEDKFERTVLRQIAVQWRRLANNGTKQRRRQQSENQTETLPGPAPVANKLALIIS